MKNNKLHILLSVFLLALVLVGRVGIHVFHHHDSIATNKSTAVGKLASTGSPLVMAGEHEADCALCKLDTFQEFSIAAILVYGFFLTVLKPIDRFLLAEFSLVSFFAKSRGPPSSVCLQ